jgi:hypothetical protein
MKKLLFLLLITISATISAQEYNSLTLFDMVGVTGDTIRPMSLKLSKGAGQMIEVDFTDVNCDLLGLDIGYGLTDFAPQFLDTIPNVQLPVTLDKTVYVNTYQGIDNSTISFDFSLYNSNYIWFGLTDNVACTSGEIIVRYKR